MMDLITSQIWGQLHNKVTPQRNRHEVVDKVTVELQLELDNHLDFLTPLFLWETLEYDSEGR